MDLTIKIETIPQKEKPFIWAWIIYLAVKILTTSFYARFLPEHINLFLICICIPLLILHELINLKSSYKELLGIVVCFILIIITMRLKFMGGGGTDIALMFTFIYCARKVSFCRVAKYTIGETSFLVAFIIISSFLGIIDNYMETGARFRQYVGFRYALFGPAFLFNVTLLLIYIRKMEISWKEIVIVSLADIFLYIWTDSRLSFGLTLLALLFAIIAKYKWKYFNQKHWWYWLVVFSFAICAFISFIMTVRYDSGNEFLKNLNRFLGGRLSLGQTSLMKYGVNMWGQNIEWVGNGLDIYGRRSTEAYLYVDCLYIQLLQHYGIVFLGLIIVLLTSMMGVCYKHGNYYLLIIFGFIAAHCILDDSSWQLYYNTFWLAVGTMLMHRNNKLFSQDMEIK